MRNARTRRWWLTAARSWLAASLLAAVACVRAETPPPASERLLPLEVVVNGAKSGSWLLVERNGVLYAPRDAFEEWRLERPSGAEKIDVKGEAYWSLAAIAGFKSRVDFSSQSVELFFSPQAFSASRLTKEIAKRPEIAPVLPSVFFNYDLSYSGSSFRDTARVDDVGLLSELGISTGWGVLTTSSVARNLLADPSLGDARRWLRLETTFTRDYPARNLTLRVGDTTTRPAMWERDVYFGGVRFGTNFALTPGYVAQPIPVMTGLSTAPSTVELYVNDVLRQVSNVPTGPFAIDNPTALTGGGEARLVVRDLLGRETVIVQSFFTASQLLAAGLDDWSVEAGRVRRDLGQASDHYGPAFAAGTWRRGVTNGLTLEGRVEALRDRQSAGGSMVTALPWQWLGKAALAMSHGDEIGAGTSWLVGVERQGIRTAMSVQAQGASRAFRQVGEDDSSVPTRVQVAGNATYASDRLGTFGFGFATIRRYDNPRVTTLSASHSIRVARQGSLTFSVSRAIDGVSGTAIGLTFVMPLERNRVASAVANSHSGHHDLYATASQNPGPGSDIGWRALAGELADRGHAEAGVYYMGTKGVLSADASVSPDQRTIRLGAGGGVVVADGRLFATRRVEQSVAIVELPGYANIGVGIGSNMLARTDANGVALVPRLLPYQSNAVRVDPSDLPVSAELDTIEMPTVPAWRSAVKVKFPVRTGRAALLKIVFDDGEPAPAGAVVQIPGDTESFYVARRGEAFVTGLQDANRLQLEWKGARCAIDVAVPPTASDDIARIGPLACRGIAR